MRPPSPQTECKWMKWIPKAIKFGVGGMSERRSVARWVRGPTYTRYQSANLMIKSAILKGYNVKNQLLVSTINSGPSSQFALLPAFFS